MSDNSQAHELLAMLHKMIADDELATMERTKRRCEHDNPAIDRWIKEEWNQFYLRVEPIRKQQEYILKQLATIEACNPPAPVILPTGHTRLP